MLFTPENYNEFDPEKISINSSFNDKYYVKQYEILYNNTPLEIETPVCDMPKGLYKNQFNRPTLCVQTTNLPFMKFIKKVENAINKIVFERFKTTVKMLFNNNMYLGCNPENYPICHINGESRSVISCCLYHSTPLRGTVKYHIPYVTYVNHSKNVTLTTYMIKLTGSTKY